MGTRRPPSTASTPKSLTVRRLTPRRWDDFVDLMDQGGPAGRCWCAYWQIGAGYRRQSPEANRESYSELVRRGPSPGLLAYDGELAVGWCQVTPRSRVPAIDAGWRLAAVDEVAVWALTCFYVRKGHRRQGVMGALIEGALQHARRNGAPALEAYPLDGSVSPSATSTGYLSTFAAAGFVEVARRSPERPVMRYIFGRADAGRPTG